MLNNGFRDLILNFFYVRNPRVSGSRNKHRKKFKRDKSADRKNGALILISPINPPITGPRIKPNPKAAPIIAKFFFFSFALEISAK